MELKAFFHLLNALWMIGLPITLSIYLFHMFRNNTPTTIAWRILLIGAAAFVLAQVLHIPFNQYMLFPALKTLGIASLADTPRLLVNAVAAGLSAGVFESVARYLAYRYWAKEARSWSRGLILGTGHGGIEAVILGALALWGFLQATAMRNANLAQFFSGEQLTAAQQQVSAYWAMNWYTSLLGGWERTFALLMHLAASLLVLQVFLRKQFYWLGLAIGWHALLDAGTVYLVTKHGVYWTEGWVALMGLLSLGIILLLRQPEAPTIETPTSAPPLKPLELAELPKTEETAEQLEKTRYRT